MWKRLLFQKNSHQAKRGGSSFLFRTEDSQRILRPSITQGGGVQTISSRGDRSHLYSPVTSLEKANEK
ncbi:hypothetical protein CEXT_141971 [Caerostris extrusa]|uniref:Uncharacterized protein n=1 Tax=Caerostris extrusa TaxID=172846 RepID=A0AAV4QNX2_CAEEX|nr:hypothetical protein CEXT_141971 [Caerostris extrusa]